MKIIKKGDPRKYKPEIEFVCQKCGCVFVAEYGEYEKHESQIQGTSYMSKCPECGYTASKDV